ncbi:unnamed protein product [Sphagnum jensenii]|uniref:Uncharacterized protein n=1 Tax=Sphagnum jensenii TaxID=128206 RepID=A0ABP0XAM3_9BRYO
MRRGWVEKRTKKKDEKSARKENLRFPVRGQVRTKRRCGDEAQSGSLVGKETTKKEKDEVWMKQKTDEKDGREKFRPGESALSGKETEATRPNLERW